MLRRIGLQNFKCWRELDIELAPITLFFGVNSSGKTAILESLLMLKQTARGIDPGQHINFGGTDRDFVDLGSYQDVVHGHDFSNDLSLRIDWLTSLSTHYEGVDLGSHFSRFESTTYEAAWTMDKEINISQLRYTASYYDNQEHVVATVTRNDDGRYTFSSSLNSEPIRRVVDSPESCFRVPVNMQIGDEHVERTWTYELSSAFREFVDRLLYIGPLRQHPERHYLSTGGRPNVIDPDGANVIQALIASVRDDEWLYLSVARQLKNMKLVDAFNVSPIDIHNRLYEATVRLGRTESSLVDVGFGISQVLPVITMLMSAPEDSIILIEQPELHLHPNAQAALADLMLQAAKQRNLQLIVESHSEHIVRRLQRRMAEAEQSYATPENVKMYYCQPGQDGSTIEQVDLDRFGQISNWPERFFGDVSGDLHAMVKSALERRSQELESVGSGG